MGSARVHLLLLEKDLPLEKVLRDGVATREGVTT